MEHNCVFCHILKGEIPSTKVYEDELVYAFFDIAPLNPGHTLIIPKEHHNSLTTVGDEYLARMMQVAPKLGQALSRAIDGDGFNLHLSNGQCAGQVVPHAHLHVVPRTPTDGFSWGFRTGSYESDEQRDALAADVILRLSQTEED